MPQLSLMPPPRSPAERFARIVAWLCAAVAASVERPAMNKPGLPGPLIVLIWTRLNRMAHRVARLAARIEAGTLKPPRKREPRACPRPVRPPPALRLPRGRAWLRRLVPGIGFGTTQLEALLAEPEMQVLLEAAPQSGRTLRPYWHMLTTAPLPHPDTAPSARAGRHAPSDPSAARPSPPYRPPPAPEVAGPARGLPVPA